MREHAAATPRPFQQNTEAVRSLAAHRSLLTLVSEGAPDVRALARLAVPMTESDFLSMCEERSLAHKCGNPLCAKEHRHMSSQDTACIDWTSLAILKVSVDQHWCSNECHTKCAQFAKSLGNAMDRLDVLQKLKAGPSLVSHNGSANQHDESDAMIKGILGSVKEHSVAARTLATSSPANAPAADGACVRFQGREDTEAVSVSACRSATASGSQDGAMAQHSPTGSTGTVQVASEEVAEDRRRQAEGDAAEAVRKAGGWAAAGGAVRGRRRSRTAQLMTDLQRSLQSPITPAEADDFDFTDSHDECEGVWISEQPSDGQTDTSDVVEAAPKPVVVYPAAESLVRPSVQTAQVDASQPAIGSDNTEAPADFPKGGHPAAPPAIVDDKVPPTPLAAETTGAAKHASYATVKGKFKPRRPAKAGSSPQQQQPDPPVSNPRAHASLGQAGGGEGGCSNQAPPSRPSGAPFAAETLHDSEGRPAPSLGSKRVTFSSCQMYEYDPELPPAESGEADCVCEVPLLPAATSSCIQVFPHTLSSTAQAANVGPAWDRVGAVADPTHSSEIEAGRWVRCRAVEGVSGLVDRAPSSGTGSDLPESKHHGPSPCTAAVSHRSSDGATADKAAQGSQHPDSRAATPDGVPDDEVTPVLYFDVHGKQSEGAMEGALRVTTAEALQLSPEDLEALHAQMGAGRGASAAAELDVQAGDADSSDESPGGQVEEPVSEDEYSDAAGQRPVDVQRRPRLRRRRHADPAVEISQASLSVNQQHQLNRQAVADAFRYYLAPEAGGVGVGATGSALHQLAADLGRRVPACNSQAAARTAGFEANLQPADPERSSAGPLAGAALPPSSDDPSCSMQDRDAQHSSGAGAAGAEDGRQAAGTGGDEHASAGDSESSEESWSSDSTQDEEEDVPDPGAEVLEGDTGGEENVGDGETVEGYYEQGASAHPCLSVFGISWRLLGIWACQASVQYLHKPGLHAAQCFPEHTRKGQRALTSVLLNRVAPLVEGLGMAPKVPLAAVEAEVHDALATLDVRLAVPTMALPVQDSLVLVLLAAVSRHRMPQLADALQTGSPRMAAALEQAELTPELFACLVDCLVDSA
eukprot:jgi/Ulvmu1/3040/UM015_0080.1